MRGLLLIMESVGKTHPTFECTAFMRGTPLTISVAAHFMIATAIMSSCGCRYFLLLLCGNMYVCMMHPPFTDTTYLIIFPKGLGYSDPQAMESLLNMVGLEYKLLLVDGEAPIFEDLQQLQQQPEMPRLIVIRQCMRSTRVHVEVQAIYYILHGTVYQCPSVESVLSSRLRKAAYLLDSALIELEPFAKLDSKMCYTWNKDWQAEEDITSTIPAQMHVPLPSSIYDRSILGILEED